MIVVMAGLPWGSGTTGSKRCLPQMKLASGLVLVCPVLSLLLAASRSRLDPVSRCSNLTATVGAGVVTN
jgi:hypothetical protein